MFVAALASLAPFLIAPLSASAAVNLATPDTSALSQGLVGYWSMDGNTINWNTETIQDLSGEGNTGTLTSLSTTTSQVVGKIGGALLFNGSNYINLGDSVSFSTNTEGTISAWIKQPAFSAGTVIFGKGGNASGSGTSCTYTNVLSTYVYNTSGAIGFRVYNNSGTEVLGGHTNTDITANTWNNIAVVMGPTGLQIYINGASTTITFDGAGESSVVEWFNNINTTGKYTIGALTPCARGFGQGYTGSIDDVRVYNRPLSPQEVQMLYEVGTFNLGNTPSTNSSFSIDQAGLNSGLVGYWPLDGNTTSWTKDQTSDVSGNGHTMQFFSMSTTSSPVAGVIGGALSFNGSDYATTTSGAPTLSSPWTMSAWVKSDSNGSGGWYPTAFGFYGNSSSYLGVCFYDSDFKMCSDGETGGSGKSFTQGKWYYLTMVYNGSNSLSLYENGVFDYTQSVSGTPHWQSSTEIALGNTGFNNGSYTYNFTGDVDDVRVYDLALSAQEILDLYNAGKVNVDHSNTTSTTGINSGLAAYWTFDGPTINWRTDTVADESGNGNTGTLIDFSTSSSPTAGKIGQALKFNGSSSYISTAYTIPAQSSTTSFTWSAWVKLNVSGGTTVILGFRNASTWVKLTPSAFEYSGGSIISNTIPTEQWLLITVVKNGTNFTYYQNGLVIGTASNSSTVGSHTFYMGYDPGYSGDGVLNGALDDVRIYNRALSAQEVEQLYQMGQ